MAASGNNQQTLLGFLVYKIQNDVRENFYHKI